MRKGLGTELQWKYQKLRAYESVLCAHILVLELMYTKAEAPVL